ncbi:MAG: ferritin-like domain-containing protein [Magnetospirillum sp.]
MTTLSQAAVAALLAADPAEKCRLTRDIAARWRDGALDGVGDTPPPDRPARPERPQLLPPKDMPKRAYKGDRGRIGLLHALAHIELNAIDLAWDIIARFTAEDMPKGFYDDWIQVAVDEALHFQMLEELLASLGAAYGDLPAHDGLWQAAEKTADDLAARLVVVPMTLEARGLDTTPATMERLARNGDTLTPPALDVIYQDEITHVAAGVRWFKHLAEKRGWHGKAEYHRLMAERFPGGLKAPFNHPARAEAGFDQDWYEELAKTP